MWTAYEKKHAKETSFQVRTKKVAKKNDQVSFQGDQTKYDGISPLGSAIQVI